MAENERPAVLAMLFRPLDQMTTEEIKAELDLLNRHPDLHLKRRQELHWEFTERLDRAMGR